jgi:hypothetical protein
MKARPFFFYKSEMPNYVLGLQVVELVSRTNPLYGWHALQRIAPKETKRCDKVFLFLIRTDCITNVGETNS